MKAAICRFAVLSLLIGSSAVHAQSGFDTFIDDTVQRYQLPGIAVGVIQNGEVVYRRTAGELVAGSGHKIDADTLFKIASNSKAMTTAVLARLVDAGKLKWDDPVVRHLPEFRMHDPWVTQQMQVRDLLIHNSGMGAGAGDLMLWPEPNLFTRADVIRGLRHLKPLHSFRSRYAYDNTLYIVAGEVAAAAAGIPYEALLRRELFEPLNMSRCQVGEWRRDTIGNVAQPHMRSDGKSIVIRADGEVVPAIPMAAAGGIRCSLDDMLTWAKMWLAPERAGLQGGKPWLSAAQRDALWTAHMPMPLSRRMRDWDGSHFSAYGYGWRLTDVDGTSKVSHTGTLAGMYSVVTLLPQKKAGFVILINADADEARTVLNQVLVKHFTAPEQGRSVAFYADALAAEKQEARSDAAVATPPSRHPASSREMEEWLGVYNDPWFGEVSVCKAEGKVHDKVRFSAAKSPMLTGDVMLTGDRLRVDWRDASVDAEPWLTFAGAGKGASRTLKMSKIDPEADFSYDYEDLSFTRVRDCP
ncbi:MAG: serine hydrolase domain-containing protein [Luteimonas sp.]